MRQIIGFTGLAGSGKNTVANIIQELYPNKFVTMSFGSALKDVTSVMFNWPRELLEGDTIVSREFRETKDVYWSEKFGKDWTPRIALQWLGTDVMRNQLDKDFWFNIGMKKINDLPKDKGVLITDVRFVNEIEGLKASGAQIWRVCLGKLPSWFNKWESLNRVSYDNKIDPYTCCDIPEILNMHRSEVEWIGVDKPDVIIHPMEKGLDLLKSLVKEQANHIR